MPLRCIWNANRWRYSRGYSQGAFPSVGTKWRLEAGPLIFFQEKAHLAFNDGPVSGSPLLTTE